MSAPATPAPASSPSFGDRLRHWRLKVISHPAFQRWAAGFPLTRPLAERHARALFDLCAGFVYTQVLTAGIQLGLFDKLAQGPRTSASLAPELGLDLDAAERLLRAAAALKLLTRLSDGRWALSDLGAALIGNPAIAAFVEHHTLLYEDLVDPVALLRNERPTRMARFWPYASRKPGDPPLPETNAEEERAYARYCDLMSRSQALVAEDVLDAYPPRGRKRWLDVGGGEGAFISAVAARAPDLELMLFDLPPVAARAREKLAQRGLAGRVTVHEGDFLADALPEGADILSLVRILHDHDDESARALLARAHAALRPGGVLLIAEPMAATRGAEPVGDAYFGFYLLAMGRGKARNFSEISALVEAAGFRRPRDLKARRPLIASVAVADRV